MAGLKSRLGQAVRRPDSRALLAALLALAVLLPAWWLAADWYADRLLAQERADAALETSLRASTLSSVVNRKLARLQGLYAFVQVEIAEADVAREFQPFAAGLCAGTVGIRTLAVAPGGVVRYVYPVEGNQGLLGTNPAVDADAEARLDVQRAIQSGEVALTLPRDTASGGGRLIARQAVYQGGAYWGLVSMELDLATILHQAGLDEQPGGLELALRQGTRVFYGSEQVFADKPVLSTIRFPADEWEMAAAPADGWQAAVRGPLRVFQLGGLVIVGLLAALVSLSASRQAGLALAVRHRTRTIAAVNAQLKQAVADRARAHELLEHRIEERTRELSLLLGMSAAFTSTLELPLLLEKVLEQLRQVMEYDGASVWILEGDELRNVAHRGPILRDVQSEMPLSRQQAGGLWEALEGHAPLIIGDVQEDTGLAQAFRRALGGYLGRELSHVRTWIGFPLLAQERLIGWLSLYHGEPNAYAPHQVALAQTIANQAATAIENAQLYAQARRLAVLEERQRLARELHDSVSQALYGIALGASTARELLGRARLAPELKSRLMEALDYVLSLNNAGQAEMRALIFDLRPDFLEREGLVAGLARQADAAHARLGLEVRTELCCEPALPYEVKEALYRIAQEALNNAAKHAQASRLDLRLVPDDEGIALEVQDDGVGFDPERDYPGRMGLRSMRERAAGLGGALQIQSSPGHGTRLRVWIPLREAPGGPNAGQSL